VSRRTRIAAACAFAVVVIAGANVATASEPTTIRAVDVSGFPLVRVTVSAETSALTRSNVRVAENGVPVQVVRSASLDELGNDVSAVLAIDVSNSMRGTSLQTAIAAANTFLASVPPTMPVGVIAFAEAPTVLAPLGDDHDRARAAVASIGAETTQGTALFDAVVAASGLFDPADGSQKNVILVTDGRNTTGTADEAAAQAAAADAGASLFTIGLAGPTTDEEILGTLARETGGAYAAISPTQLESVYAGIADQLVNQYVVEYRSKAPYGAPVNIVVRTPFGAASTGFLAPGLKGLPGHRSASPASVVDQDWIIGGIALLTFVAMLGCLVAVSNVRDARRRAAQLASRVQAPVAPGWPGGSAARPSNPLVPKQIADLAERSVGSKRTLSLGARLRQAGWGIGAGEFVALAALAALLMGGVGWFFAGPVVAVAAAAVSMSAPFVALGIAAQRRLSAIQSQLADTLLILAGAMRGGHSFLQALDTAAKEIDEPAASEFGQVLSEIRLGRNVDDALDALVERVGSTDLEWAVTAIKIQRQIGGNLAEVLETVANTIRERETLRRQVKVLSAEGRLSMAVLVVLPVLIAVYLMITNPDYLKLLTASRGGLMMLGGSVGLLGIGFVWMRRIVNLDV